MREPVLVVHGGAGRVPPSHRAAHVASCRAAAEAGYALLEAGGSALDAVERAVQVMEDDPSLNAGTGSALTADGRIELDACIMEGTKLRAGGVCALPPFHNPIRVARAVLEDGRHVLYAGEGAAAFAQSCGFAPAPLSAMRTEGALARLRATQAGTPWAGGDTVGAVACDGAGRLAAATSTGGTMGKRAGRVGDSPIPGAGAYADDTAGAASATGQGESILRMGLGRTVVDLARTATTAQEAAERGVAMLADRLGGMAGIILVCPDGTVGIAFNTTTMGYAVARPQRIDAGCVPG
jgi:L-asparaginase / beta-aspartyl-peptidase